jgi:DNA-binding transcriptional ArsR family regulator
LLTGGFTTHDWIPDVMAGILYQKDVRVRRVTTLNHVAAQGLNDPARMRILEVLAHKPMTAEEIAKALGNAGLKKATTTIRHHLDTLKGAGLVEPAKMVEARGAVMKYYSATMKVYNCQVPADLDVRAARLIDDASARLLKIVRSITDDRRFGALVDKDGRCKEFLALEIVNAALARMLEKKEYVDLVAKEPQARK